MDHSVIDEVACQSKNRPQLSSVIASSENNILFSSLKWSYKSRFHKYRHDVFGSYTLFVVTLSIEFFQ